MPSTANRHPTLSQSYAERSSQPNLTPLAIYLLRLIHLKRTNLCVSADVTTTAELLRVAEEVGEHICVLKTHADIITDFGGRTIRGLNEVARRKKFLVFEDRKLGDIGNTVQQQYVGGPLTIVRWAPIVNAHLFPGPSVITALAQAAQKAIAAHNTSVSTDISASPAPSELDGGNDNESVESLGDDDDDESAPYSEDEDRDEEEEEEELPQERMSRKQSVVSVSTTISTKTEAMSPRPTAMRPSLSCRSKRTSQDDDDAGAESSEEEEEDRWEAAEAAQRLEELGPPPFFRALLLLAEMSSADNLLTPEYTAACVRHAREHRDFVLGFVAQRSLNAEPGDNFITLTPGVGLHAAGDALGQQYHTPRAVVAAAGSDIIIVGRGVLAAPDRCQAAAEYRRLGWEAYEERLREGRARARSLR